jgi:hypothetical protein
MALKHKKDTTKPHYASLGSVNNLWQFLGFIAEERPKLFVSTLIIIGIIVISLSLKVTVGKNWFKIESKMTKQVATEVMKKIPAASMILSNR